MDLVNTLKAVVPKRFWPYLGVTRRWLRTIPPQVQLQKGRLLADSSISASERVLLSQVSTRIYFNDGMYNGDGAHYFKVGRSAIRCNNEAIESAGLAEVRSILDFPCGSGLVLRFL